MTEFSSRIPELQFDVVARIIPGAIALASYSAHDFSVVSGVGTLFIGLIAAYVIGFSIELVALPFLSGWSTNHIFRKFHKPYGWCPMDTEALWKHRNTTNGPKSDIIFKMLGEQTMFRSLLFLAIVWCNYPPMILLGRHWIALTAVVAFANAFYWNSRFLSCTVHEDINQQPKA